MLSLRAQQKYEWATVKTLFFSFLLCDEHPCLAGLLDDTNSPSLFPPERGI